MVNLIGDSHVTRFQLYPDRIRTHYIGARTAHQISKHHEECVAPLLVKHTNERFVFVLGEVDCRIHIYHKAMTTEQTPSRYIRGTIDRYLAYVSVLTKDISLAVLSVVPTGVENGSVYGYRHCANDATRKEITLEFNAVLRQRCEDLGLRFIDIYPHLIDSNGIRRSDLVYDTAHINYPEEAVKAICDG
jgi:hypothetical protein